MFWGDARTANARTSLRQALAALRRTVTDRTISTDNVSVKIDPAAITTDVGELELEATRDLPDPARLGALYDGDLLQDLNVRSQVFEDWLAIERERLRQLTTTALERTLGAAETPDAQVAIASTLVTLDPLNEAVHRTLMVAYARTGQAGAALRQFKRAEAVLQRELGTPPALETVQLLQTIRRGELNETTPESRPAGPSAQPAPAPSQTHTRTAVLPSIAVLPFASMSADPEHGYLADGMTEELINLLSHSVNWRVTARNSSFRYKNQNVDVREVGKELGVSYIVEGSIRRVGKRIRVTAQLVTAEDGTHIWSDTYDRPLDEIFDVQDEVMHGVFRVLKNRIGFAERERARKTQSANLDAWSLIIKANQIQVTDRTTREAQRAMMREALEIDPDYPRAHAYLSSVMFTAVGRGYSDAPRDDYKAAQQHADSALAAGAPDPVVLKVCAGGYAAVGKANESAATRRARVRADRKPRPAARCGLVMEWPHRRCVRHLRSHRRRHGTGGPPHRPASSGPFRCSATSR